MSRSLARVYAGSAILALVALSSGVVRGADAPRGDSTIVGRVIDLDGRPVAGAEIWTEARDQAEARVRSGADGRFRLGAVNDERAPTIWVEAPDLGLAREHFENIRIFKGRESDVGDLTLAPGARLSGRVVDAKNQPVASSTITIASRRHVMGYTITHNGPPWTVKGDNDGRFRLPTLPVGLAEFAIRAPGKALRHTSQRIEPGRPELDLGDVRLDDERPITGVVVDQDGRPLRGASVVVDAEYDHPGIADDKGNFAVRDAAIDAQWFLAEAHGYFDPTLAPFHELKGKRTDLRIVLQEAFGIEGSVIDADTGAPVEFKRVQLCTVERDKDNTVSLLG